ncbi:MAG: hypothetical protein UHN47_07010 [Lachnospiraceae bacterium]|nr:hypothetical protein [Lachnospiraceae bacterium]
MKKDKRKIIHFNLNDMEEKNAFDMLEKVRYYQSKLITKLVNDFCETHDITLDSPYHIIRKNVLEYIGVNSAISHQYLPFNDEILAIATKIYLEQKNNTVQLENEVVLQKVENTTYQLESIKPSEHPSKNESMSTLTTFLEDDDDEEDDDISIKQMAFGFQSLVE